MEKALAVTISFAHHRDGQQKSNDDLQELIELISSCKGAKVVHSVLCSVREPSASLLMGTGKAEELHELCHEHDIDCVVFDEELSPNQQRNLEDVLGVKTIDRTQLILDIFARRAHSREGKVQVECAQLSYLLPRLTGKGIALSRLGGGIGTRGPGEQKIEVDRRRIRQRLTRLKDDLLQLKERRHRLRRSRKERALPVVALVGYTNAGKSTLLKKLTQAHVVTSDGLFTTLDPRARLYVLPNNQKVLLSDTVGFIQRLPHHLVESFHATLEEVKEADLLLHVVDISSSQAQEKYAAVNEVLAELDANEKPVITVLNKIDQMDDDVYPGIARMFENAVALSAVTGSGMESLITALSAVLKDRMCQVSVIIPHTRMDMVSRLYAEGTVERRDDTPRGIELDAIIPHYLSHEITAYINVPVQPAS